MGDRRKERGRRKKERQEDPAPSRSRAIAGVEVFGWTILAHPLFLTQIEKLVVAAESEHSDLTAQAGPNAKLLAHLLDLAFNRIPREPGNPAFRHGGTLGQNRKHWFRGKTGNGRYRLFYRFQSAAKIIVYAWVNDEQTLRSYGGTSDAYAVFARMLNTGNPPEDWHALVRVASKESTRRRLDAVASRRAPKR
jgi:toxin YhaV